MRPTGRSFLVAIVGLTTLLMNAGGSSTVPTTVNYESADSNTMGERALSACLAGCKGESCIDACVKEWVAELEAADDA